MEVWIKGISYYGADKCIYYLGDRIFSRLKDRDDNNGFDACLNPNAILKTRINDISIDLAGRFVELDNSDFIEITIS